MYFLAMEIWKDIPGYEGLYQASTEGRLKSLPKLHRARHSYTQPEKIVTGSLNNGYLQIRLKNKDGVRKSIKVHSLIIRTFKGPVPEGKECAHGNGIKIDNRLLNLEYKTHLDNIVGDERRLKDKSVGAVLTDSQVVEIKGRILKGENDRSLAECYKVHPETIGYIRRNKSRKHIPWPTV